MAAVIYPKWKEAAMQGTSAASLASTNVRFVLVRSYTYSATHQFLSDVGVSGTNYHPTYSDNTTGRTYTNGRFSTANPKFTAPAANGNSYDKLILMVDNGSAGTNRLVAMWDTVPGFPVTPNGGDINFTTDANGHFDL